MEWYVHKCKSAHSPMLASTGKEAALLRLCSDLDSAQLWVFSLQCGGSSLHAAVQCALNWTTLALQCFTTLLTTRSRVQLYSAIFCPPLTCTIVHWSPSIGVGHCTIGCNGCNIAMQYNGWTADTLQHKQNHNNDSCYKYYMEIIVSVDKFATLYISKCKSDWT